LVAPKKVERGRGGGVSNAKFGSILEQEREGITSVKEKRKRGKKKEKRPAGAKTGDCVRLGGQ